MNKIFQIHMLPAREGDAIWIVYGEESQPHHILIDGGTQGTYAQIKEQITALPPDGRLIDLLVVTHVDSDHIGGILSLVEDESLGVHFKDIWFNGWHHLPGSELEAFGPPQGEKLSTHIKDEDLPWNHSFHQKAAAVPADDPPPTLPLPGGMELTLLSPGVEELKNLLPYWRAECKKAGMIPGQPAGHSHPAPAGFEVMGPVNIESLAGEPSPGDDSKANASSVAFLAAFDHKRVLFAGDAHADVLLNNIQKITPADQRLRLDAFKLPHHGSKSNLNQELLDAIKCPRYLFSTNGSRHNHPDRQAVAKVIKYGGDNPKMFFNYRSPENQIWDHEPWMDQYGYSVVFPQIGQEGLLVDLSS